MFTDLLLDQVLTIFFQQQAVFGHSGHVIIIVLLQALPCT